jgi:hypothetical protein
MDVNIKGLEAEVVARLAGQAEIEGVSAQEWMRQALRRTAGLLTPTELGERAAGRRPASEQTYRETMAHLVRSRAAVVHAKVDSERVRHRGR